MKTDKFWDFGAYDKTVSDERIAFVESICGVKFPKLYIDLIKECDGGYPLKDQFDYYDVFDKELLSCGIGKFSNLNDGEGEAILDFFLDPPEFFPKDLIIFAGVGNGDLICFDYRNGKDNLDPPIVYWCHESPEGEDVSFIAKNFEEFIGMLREFDESVFDDLDEKEKAPEKEE